MPENNSSGRARRRVPRQQPLGQPPPEAETRHLSLNNAVALPARKILPTRGHQQANPVQIPNAERRRRARLALRGGPPALPPRPAPRDGRTDGRAAPGCLGTRPESEAAAPRRRHLPGARRASRGPASAWHGPASQPPAPVTQPPPRHGPSAARGRERCPQPLPGKASRNTTDGRREQPPAAPRLPSRLLRAPLPAALPRHAGAPGRTDGGREGRE